MTRRIAACITVLVAAFAACTPKTAPEAKESAPTNEELAARGAKLVKIGDCGGCHTPMVMDPVRGAPAPDMKRMLSGHPEGAPDPVAAPGQGDQGVISSTFTAFSVPFGVVYAANLTPDPETGTGRWTEKEFVDTMRTGLHKGTGRAVLPPMPWPNLAGQSDEDLRAIYQYLRTIPAVHNNVPEPKVPPPVLVAMAKNNAETAKAVR